MTPEEHQEEHKRLHRALDGLLGCYLSENIKPIMRDLNVPQKARAGSIHNPILDLLQWAHQKTMVPSSAEYHHAISRTPADFEAERQLILLALAELALSRPGWDESIREVARFYDDETLCGFEAFQKANADRVKETHRDLRGQPL